MRISFQAWPIWKRSTRACASEGPRLERRRSRLYPWIRAALGRLERGAPPRISSTLSRNSAKAGRRPALQSCWIRANLSYSEKSSVYLARPHTGDFRDVRNFEMCEHGRDGGGVAIF